MKKMIELLNDKDFNILLSTGMTKSDAQRHLEELGVIIYELEDYKKNFENYTADLDDEAVEELREFIEKGEDGSRIWDNEITEYNGVKYYIEYML